MRAAVIVTVSTNVLTAGKIKFTPDLPKRQLDAAARLKLGSYDHVVLELPGNPLGLRPDELVFEKSDSARTASVFANMSGSSLCMVDVAGSFGRDLAAKGDAAMFDFAFVLADRALRHRHEEGGQAPIRDPLERRALGARRVLRRLAGRHSRSRKVLMEPLNNRLWFAGEAVHETLWGTVGGAWESGERTADAVAKTLGKK